MSLVQIAASLLDPGLMATAGIGAMALGLIGLLWYLSQENVPPAEAEA